MCNPKSSGKGRCFVHSALSKFTTRETKQNTGASDAMIQETTHLMNQENKHLERVSGEKATDLVHEKMFNNETNENIDEHERKIRRNQLRRAREEVKDGVAGNHFYTWKNLQKRVAARMRKLAWVGLLFPTIALTSCSAGVHTTPSHSPSPSVSTSQTASPNPSASTAGLGVVQSSGQKITDSKGTYETVKPDDSKVAQGFVQEYNTSLQQNGFSQADSQNAQKFVSDFVLTQGLDSTALDNGTAGWDSWKKSVGPKYVYPSQASALLDQPGANSDRSGIIFNDPNNKTPDFIRDGSPRIKTEGITINDVVGASHGSVKYVQVSGTATATYRMSYDEKIQYIHKLNPTKSISDIKSHYPDLGDKNTYSIKYNFLYAVTPAQGSWQIVGYDTNSHADLDK